MAQAELALRVCDGMVEAAVLWLLRMGQTAAAGPPGGEPPSANPEAQPASTAQPGASPQEPGGEQGPSTASTESSRSLPSPRGGSGSDASAGSGGEEGTPAGQQERSGEGVRGCSLQAGAEEAGSAAQREQPRSDDHDDEGMPPRLIGSDSSDSEG